jgi:hypothetical protein
MNKRNLLVCPTCEEAGEKQVLGEIDTKGDLLVMRFHKGFTKVVSNEFMVTCGNCGNIIYRKVGSVFESNPVMGTADPWGTTQE